MEQFTRVNKKRHASQIRVIYNILPQIIADKFKNHKVLAGLIPRLTMPLTKTLSSFWSCFRQNNTEGGKNSRVSRYLRNYPLCLNLAPFTCQCYQCESISYFSRSRQSCCDGRRQKGTYVKYNDHDVANFGPISCQRYGHFSQHRHSSLHCLNTDILPRYIISTENPKMYYDYCKLK